MTVRHSFVCLAVVTAGFLALSQTVDTQGGPSISGTNGTLQHGSTLTISGSNFGSKPAGAPWKWDAMDGANGARLEPRGWLVHQNNPQPLLTTQRTRPGTGSTASALLTQTGDDVPLFGFGDNEGGYLSLTAASAANLRPVPERFRLDYWMYFHPPTGSNNYKFVRSHANNSSSIPNWLWGMPSPNASGVGPCSQFTWSSLSTLSQGSLPSLSCPVIADKWVHVQILWDGTNDSTPGLFWMQVDGIQYFNSPGWQYEQGGTRRGTVMIESQQLTTTGDGQMFIDDMMVEDGFAAIEIGDAPTYAASRHRETQIPISWSNGSVSVTLNRGSFPSFSGLYLYVINASGVASPGYSLSGGGGSSSQPNAPYNLRIVP